MFLPKFQQKIPPNSKPNSWGNMHLFHGQGNTVLERKTPTSCRQVGLVAGARGMWRKSPMKGALGDVLQEFLPGTLFWTSFGGVKSWLKRSGTGYFFNLNLKLDSEFM